MRFPRWMQGPRMDKPDGGGGGGTPPAEPPAKPEPEVIPEWAKKLQADVEAMKTSGKTGSGAQEIPKTEPPKDPTPPASTTSTSTGGGKKGKSFWDWLVG